MLPAASKASGVDTGAPASASCPYVTNAESPLMPAGAHRPLAGIVAQLLSGDGESGSSNA